MTYRLAQKQARPCEADGLARCWSDAGDRSITAGLARNSGDVFVASIMTVSFCITLGMIGYEVSDLGPRLRFDVYDASIFQGAHWLLHKREESQGMNITAHERGLSLRMDRSCVGRREMEAASQHDRHTTPLQVPSEHVHIPDAHLRRRRLSNALHHRCDSTFASAGLFYPSCVHHHSNPQEMYPATPLLLTAICCHPDPICSHGDHLLRSTHSIPFVPRRILGDGSGIRLLWRGKCVFLPLKYRVQPVYLCRFD